MPTLYEYFGLTVLFYSNAHEPIHVHGKYQGCESKAEILVEEGKIVNVRIVSVRGRCPRTETIGGFSAAGRESGRGDSRQMDSLLRTSQALHERANRPAHPLVLAEDTFVDSELCFPIADLYENRI